MLVPWWGRLLAQHPERLYVACPSITIDGSGAFSCSRGHTAVFVKRVMPEGLLHR
jgi:hypothetical protein